MTIKPVSGKQKNNKSAQVSIELTVALILITVLILGSARIFAWLNQCMVERQDAYDATRDTPVVDDTYDQDHDGRTDDKIAADFYTPPKLNIFPKEKVN
jgi:hypothetical protein